ncbi:MULTISPECIES: OmpH family outer membrane protein [unclassified Azospirillum]|uniref:OmpH family outer membrane protein n=1 Tax=unclassified Azospirillum TaxID=2630922 RepID=UPI000B763618|nr:MULTISPECIES: OmpH family outer membrane protein [unclassified Azospirillum]SNS98926.1 periplasmic chaperone for outer membrane proteins Skp [Azospirillum sp. RU38E]SNT15227.1 periplasmic chaperone for outer membrane proteins Skp [Azospirillum sp. RU37A]
MMRRAGFSSLRWLIAGLALVAGPAISLAAPAVAQEPAGPTLPAALAQVVGEPTSVPAAPAGPARKGSLPYAQVAVVDVQRILQDAAVMRSIQQQLDRQKDQFQREVGAQQEQLRVAEQDLAKLRQSVAVEEFDRKRTDFESQVSAMGRALQERTRRLDVAFNQARNSAINTLDQVIAEVAKENGATLVISRQFIVYQAGTAGDITDEVMQRLNARLPEIIVNLPPSP